MKWVGSPNFSAGRGGQTIDFIVCHWIVGTLASADSVFQNTTRQTSAHYGVGQTEVHQYVKEEDTAWHAGDFSTNRHSIGIEHEGGPTIPITDAVYQQSAQLIADIWRRYGVLPLRKHNEFKATQCPGTLDLERLRREAMLVFSPEMKFPLFRDVRDGKVYYRGFGGICQHIPNPDELNRFWPGVIPEDVADIAMAGITVEGLIAEKDALSAGVTALQAELATEKKNNAEIFAGLSLEIDRLKHMILELETRPPVIITKPAEELTALEHLRLAINIFLGR